MSGNVFKDTNGTPLTQRIDRYDIAPTIQWLEVITGLSLIDNMLGSTGKKDTSGDIDLAVDIDKISKQTLIDVLLQNKIDPADIKKSGDNVHVKTPIRGNPKNGFVQTDFMFGNPSWQRFSMMGSPAGSPYQGRHRHILLASIAKEQGMKWSYKYGLVNRDTNLSISQDPTVIADKLLGSGNALDLESVETIIAKIKNRPDYDKLVANAVDTLRKENIKLPEQHVTEGSASWFRNWSNII